MMRILILLAAFLAVVAVARAEQTDDQLNLQMCDQQLADAHRQCDAAQRQTVLTMLKRLGEAEKQRDWLWEKFGKPAYEAKPGP